MRHHDIVCLHRTVPLEIEHDIFLILTAAFQMLPFDVIMYVETNIVKVAVYLWICKIVNKRMDNSSFVKGNPTVVDWTNLVSVS